MSTPVSQTLINVLLDPRIDWLSQTWMQLFTSICKQGLAESTQRTYQSGFKHFHVFCMKLEVMVSLPVNEQLLCQFAAFLAQQELSSQIVKTYLTATHNLQISLGFPDPCDTSSLPHLKLVLMGIRCLQSHSRANPARIRLPITFSILSGIKKVWEDAGINHDSLLMWAAMTVCFFGFFRSGKITVPFAAAFNPTIHLSWGDVAVDNLANPSVIHFFLKWSKHDQFGTGVEVFIRKTGKPVCPVMAALAYLASCGDAPGPFFKESHGKPLTKFIQEVWSTLTSMGLLANQFAGHSFRIGAATAAAQAGLEDSIIQALGCWSSAAFLLYIRMPWEQLTPLSVRLASAC